jgi:NAD(P)H-dependent flavin oxidoreductase YrpB (nitropropane dioxygenase family)
LRTEPELARRDPQCHLEVLKRTIQAGKVHEVMPTAGQSAGGIHEVLPAAEIVYRLVTEADSALAGITSP